MRITVFLIAGTFCVAGCGDKGTEPVSIPATDARAQTSSNIEPKETDPMRLIQRAYMSVPSSPECQAAKEMLRQSGEIVKSFIQGYGVEGGMRQANERVNQAKLMRCLPENFR